MSIAFEMTRGASPMHHGMLRFMGVFGGDRQLAVEEDSWSSSSSIGRNSDDEDSGDETEVQSSCKGPLDTMDALQEVLPFKRGISEFYNGRSKSFTSLADASSAPSIKDFAKPGQSLHNKKRKNQLVHQNKSCNFLPKGNESGLSKRSSNTCQSAMALASAMNCSRSSNISEDLYLSSSSPPCRPPLHPQPNKRSPPGTGVWSQTPKMNSPWRSFSLSDLQAVAAAASDK